MKSEPDVFGFHDLQQRPKSTEPWDGVRNYQARNFMRAMRVDDKVLFYHSNVAKKDGGPGIVGLARVSKAAYPDHTARDPKSKYYDPKATVANPIWDMVDVTYVRPLKQYLSLDTLREDVKLKNMQLFTRARLSVQQVTETEYNHILKKSEGSV